MPLLPKGAVSRKIIMAVTGLAMLLFLIAHLAGNMTIYSGSLNAYAGTLRAFPLLIWISRIVTGLAVLLHIVIGIQLWLENRDAKPEPYADNRSLSATFAGKTMIWTGLLTGGFIIYHLLHFTLQVINPEFSANLHTDSAGMADVMLMVTSGFRQPGTAFIYIAAMIAVMLHLTHGIQSSFQTLGLNSDRSMPVITKTGIAAALIISLGFASIPAFIFMGIIK